MSRRKIDDNLPTRRILSVVLLDNAENDLEWTNSLNDEEDSLEYDIQLILPKRAKISQIRFCSYLEDVVLRWSDNEWIKNLRISRELFFQLAGEYEDSELFKSCQSDVVAPVKTLVIFLWFAGHENASYRDIANRFDISLSALHVVIRRAICFVTNMAHRTILWPSVEQMEAEARYQATQYGIPGIIGAIDGARIRIIPPDENKEDYIDRKKNYSLAVQGVCNHEKKFIHASIGSPGSVRDGTIFRNSNLPGLMAACPPGYCLVGDAEYCRSATLLTPHRGRKNQLTDSQKEFNDKISSVRLQIDHAFDILKRRFRQLYFCKLSGLDVISHFIRACIVLHNLSRTSEVELFEMEQVPK